MQAELLLEALKDLKNQQGKDGGICANVEGYLHDKYRDDAFHAAEVIAEMAQKWPKWSGSLTYPVPCPENLVTSAHHTSYWAFGFLPKWEGAYGALRLELLDFLIEELENELR